MTQRVLLAGGTGLVGGFVAALLARRPLIELVGLVRRKTAGPGQAVDFEQFCDRPEATLRPLFPEGVDTAISCLGTTIRAAGSQQAMFRVDHDYVLAVARGARALGARQFILVTSVGAGGAGFYLRTKGAIEVAVADLDFERLDLIRPGILLGHRGERRLLEAIGQRMFAVLTPLMKGPLAPYGAISAETVASAIVSLIGASGPGRYVHDNSDLRALSMPHGVVGEVAAGRPGG